MFRQYLVGAVAACLLSLSAFAGDAHLSWVPPTENTDGTALTDLAGYDIYYGRGPGDLNYVVELNNPGLSQWTIEELPGGTWYFALVAKSAAGMVSAMSNVTSLAFAGNAPGPPIDLQITWQDNPEDPEMPAGVFTLVGSAVSSDTGAGDAAFLDAPAINAGAGNLIVVSVGAEFGGANDPATMGLTDTAGNSYTLIGSIAAGTSNDKKIFLFYCPVAIANATNVIRATPSADRQMLMSVAQWSYTGTVALADSDTDVNDANVTSAITGPLDTLTGDLVLGAFQWESSGVNMNPNVSPFTTDLTPTNPSMALLPYIAVADGQLSPAGTLSSSNSWVAVGAVFRATVQSASDIAGTTEASFAANARLGGYVNGVGTSPATFAQTARLSALQAAIGQSTIAFSPLGQLAGYRNAAGSSSLVFTEAALLTSRNTIAGSAALTFDSAAILKAYLSASGSTSIAFDETAALGAYGYIRGTSSIVFDPDGTFDEGALRGSSDITFGVSGNLSAYAPMRGASTLAFDQTGRLSSGSSLGGNASFAFDVSGRAAALRNASGTAALAFNETALLQAYANAVSNVELSFTEAGHVIAYANLRGQSSLVFQTEAGLASPFVPGADIFTIPFEASDYRITLDQSIFTVN
jgi:hypothetical protein